MSYSLGQGREQTLQIASMTEVKRSSWSRVLLPIVALVALSYLLMFRKLRFFGEDYI